MKLIFVFLFVYLSQDALCASSNRDKLWWGHGAIYEIDVAAFKDHDGDGFGDFQGLKSKLDYIQELGFNVIKLSPIYSSVDMTIPDYPIDNFREIHLTVGNIHDFDELMKTARSKGVKVILDFIINDCSTSHEWFKKSQQLVDPFADYFIWRDLTTEEKTEGKTGSHHWKLDEVREQLFFRQNGGDKADLNLRNEVVKQEIKELMKFWFDKGVAGLNLIKTELYIEDPLIMEEMYPNSKLLENYPESYEFIHELREFVDKYNEQTDDYERILMVDRVSNTKYDNLRGNETYPIAHIVSSNVLKDVFHQSNSPFYIFYPKKIIFKSKENLNLIQYITEESKNGPSLFVSESWQSTKRLGGVFVDQQLVNVWIMSMSMCPGILHVFYGQELGLDSFRSGNRQFLRKYPFGSSMHWDDSINAGFTSSEFSMVPPNVNYWMVNVEKYQNEQFSTLHMMKDLLELRETDAIRNGDLQTHNVTEFVFAFTRSYEDKESYLIVFNFANVVQSITLNAIWENIPDLAHVAASTPNAFPQKGAEVVTKLPLLLRPVSGMVLDITSKVKRR